jgi:hypothetical protein
MEFREETEAVSTIRYEQANPKAMRKSTSSMRKLAQV